MIVAFTVAAILGFILFLWRELTFKYPIVELRVLKTVT
jgi:DHA2 family multidrug resistance protein